MRSELSIRTLMVEGTLAGVRPGDPRDRVRAALGPPDAWLNRESQEDSRLWRYGNFEVHFDRDVVWMLFNDYTDRLDAGPGRRLDPWLFRRARAPRYDAVVERLFDEQLRFRTGRDSAGRLVVAITGGGWFTFDEVPRRRARCVDIGVYLPSSGPMLSAADLAAFLARPERTRPATG